MAHRTGTSLATNNHVMESIQRPLDPPDGEPTLGPGMEFPGRRPVHALFVDSIRSPTVMKMRQPSRHGATPEKLFPFPVKQPLEQLTGAGPKAVVSYSQ